MLEVYEMINDDKALWDVERMELLDAWYMQEVVEVINDSDDDLPF